MNIFDRAYLKKAAWFITFILFFAISAPLVFGQDAEFTPAPSQAQATPASVLDYELPYPGILPDNPLYSLKTLRDRIINFLISDPLKKAEFTLLQADKRLQAGVYLLQKNQKKEELAYTTISKGIKYLESSVSYTKEAQKQGEDSNDIRRRLFLSTKKHQMTLWYLKKKSAKNYIGQFDAFEKKLKEIEKTVNSLSLNK